MSQVQTCDPCDPLTSLMLCPLDQNSGSLSSLRSDGLNRRITFKVDSGACVTAVPGDRSATRGYQIHQDANTDCSYGTAKKGAKEILDDGTRVL